MTQTSAGWGGKDVHRPRRPLGQVGAVPPDGPQGVYVPVTGFTVSLPGPLGALQRHNGLLGKVGVDRLGQGIIHPGGFSSPGHAAALLLLCLAASAAGQQQDGRKDKGRNSFYRDSPFCIELSPI